MLPGVFEPTLFSPRIPLRSSLFIRPIHPKTEIRPNSEAVRKILEAGWVGQLKIHGHRAQIHIPSDPKEEVLVYNRQGQLHKKELTPLMLSEIRRVFTPLKNWNVIDAEWLKPEDKLYVFDFLKLNGELLHRLNFVSRWKLLPRAYISPVIQTLGVLTGLEECMAALENSEKIIEGLVFKSSSPGFEDSSIIRCRKTKN